jgi:hypothetical protein
MNTKRIAALTLAVMLAATAWAGDKVHHKMEVKIISDHGDGESAVVIDTDNLGFDMHAMQVGENNSIVEKNGRAVLVTRTEDGYTFDVDGETIEMPAFEEFSGDNVWVHGDGDQDIDVDVHVVRGGLSGGSMEGVLIFSGNEIDEATKQVIRTALESAGHTDVTFAGSDEGSDHQVRVIKQVHEVQKVTE